MNALQQYQLWIGFGLALLLLIFFIVAFFKAPDMTSSQFTILRVLSTFCAAFAGAIITGEALFRMEGASGGMRYLVSGTAGFAFAFAIWFFFPKHSPPKPPDRFRASLPKGWTFQHAVKTFAQRDNAVVDFDGFTPDELQAKLSEANIDTKTVAEAISRLRLITVKPNAIRDYETRHEDSLYRLTVRH